LVDLPETVWKTRVDLCSLLIVSVPVVAQVFPPLPLLPQLGLLANVLFVLPQLIVITGLTSDGGSSFTSLVCRLPPVQLLGRISLQIYLLHDPLLRFAMLKLHLYQDYLSTHVGSGLVTLLLSYFFSHSLPLLQGFVQKIVKACKSE